jgi:hypothetical protein
MRSLVIFLLALAAWSVPSFAPAQDQRPTPPEISKIHVGFQTYHQEDHTAYKVGLWTPVYVDVFGGTEGLEPKADRIAPYLEIETVDSEDVGTIIRVPVNVKANDSTTFIGYIKTGRRGGGNEVRVTLRANGRAYPARPEHYWTLDIDAHLYLTLGAKNTYLHQAVRAIGKPADAKEPADAHFDPSNFRHVVYETMVKRLPETWFGYNSIDLVILSTDNHEFLFALKKDAKRLGALAQWVRRGGRLLVPIESNSQTQAAALLSSGVWDPPIPVVPSRPWEAGQEPALLSLPTVAHWGGVRDEPFQLLNPKTQKPMPIEIARLDDGKVAPGNWEILTETDKESGNRSLIARVRYGLGQITYMAFSLEEPSFLQWPGKTQFLQNMVIKLAPKAPGIFKDRDEMVGRSNPGNDLATDLLGRLDDFDVKVIEFGYVALFIVLYILFVGPLDFFLLKYVFKRLEWTWITFPAVVLAVSVSAYFAAYALKGRDLKINKVDIVDFDMRTSLDEKDVHAYGHSFFTILSPRIQNYTIGVEPNPEFWGEKADKVRSVDLLSWMGRPSGGPHDMGRSGSTAFFRKPYTFREDAAGLEGVPIPVWTTKAFAASWEQTLKSPPFVAQLVYHQKEVKGRDLKIAGKLENRLAVDLVDVWLIYDDHWYPLPEGLKSARNGAATLAIFLEAPSARDMKFWVEANDEALEQRTRKSDPTSLVKSILFHERVDTQNVIRNHLLRPLDQGWRIQEERRDLSRDRRTREAILFARVRFASGPAETLTQDSQVPLPTKLWLGRIPEAGQTRPPLDGQLNQDTYIRVILPVRPAKE